MNIKSIQSTQVVPALRSPEKSHTKADSGARLSPEPPNRVFSGSLASGDAATTSVAQAQTLASRIDYIEEQLNKILVEFPPFFPPGSYQRADLIKGIRSIQEKAEKSSIPSDILKEIASEKLSENATDEEISTALDKLLRFRDAHKDSISGSLEPGTVVSIRV